MWISEGVIIWQIPALVKGAEMLLQLHQEIQPKCKCKLAEI